jgi:hypothetical protein
MLVVVADVSTLVVQARTESVPHGEPLAAYDDAALARGGGSRG